MKTVDAKAGLLRDNGNLEESEKLYEKVVDGMRSCQGFNHLVAGHENEQQFDIGSSHTVSSRVCVRVETNCGNVGSLWEMCGRVVQLKLLLIFEVGDYRADL